MQAVPSIADLLTRVPSWVGRAVTYRRMPGGLSHHVYRVEVDGIPYVLRILDPAVSAAGLGIPPAQEVDNTVRAADSVGARVHHVLADVPALVLEFLPGRTLHAPDVRDPAALPAIAAACRRLHAGPRFGNDFDIFAKRDELLAGCRRRHLPLPDGYLDRAAEMDAVRRALAAAPPPTVPCHNDLLAENFIRTADGAVRIVDYQLSGNNDPTFELGDIAAEADFDPDLVGRLASAYFGDELTGVLLARVRLQLAASNVTWALWFAVHHGLLSNPDAAFDYDGEAADKWAQARRDLDAPDLGRLLDQTAGRSPRPGGVRRP